MGIRPSGAQWREARLRSLTRCLVAAEAAREYRSRLFESFLPKAKAAKGKDVVEEEQIMHKKSIEQIRGVSAKLVEASKPSDLNEAASDFVRQWFRTHGGRLMPQCAGTWKRASADWWSAIASDASSWSRRQTSPAVWDGLRNSGLRKARETRLVSTPGCDRVVPSGRKNDVRRQRANSDPFLRMRLVVRRRGPGPPAPPLGDAPTKPTS